MPRVYGTLEMRYHHDVVFLSRAKTGFGVTIYDRFPTGAMAKGEISADLLHEERRLHELAGETCDHGHRRSDCDMCADVADPPPAVGSDDLLSDPRWDVVCARRKRPVADAAARDAIPTNVTEFIERTHEENRRKAKEAKQTPEKGQFAVLLSDSEEVASSDDGSGAGDAAMRQPRSKCHGKCRVGGPCSCCG